MLFSQFLFAVLPLGALAGPIAAPDASLEERGDRRPPGFDGKCYSVKSVVKTVTATRKVVNIPFPTVKVIYAVQTQTVTTTLPIETSVFSTTSTLFATTTETKNTIETSTASETITVDVPPPTSTIAALAGVTPIRSVYPNAAKRSLNQPRTTDPGMTKRGDAGYKVSDCKCTTTIVSTKTAKITTSYSTSTVTLPRLTFTKKRTSTITTTKSVLPVPASRTETFSTTATVTETTTNTAIVSITSTSTISQTVGPTPTFYAACGPDNIANRINGQTIGTLIFADPLGTAKIIREGGSSAYDCCVACIQDGSCAGSGWAQNLCFGLTPDNGCAGNLASGSFSLSDFEPGYSISNSQCGQWKLV